MQRSEKVLHRIDSRGRGLEIGPSYGPIAPKWAGFHVDILDHLDRDALMRKYQNAPGVDVDQIEPVDYIWNGEPYAELIGKTKCYDWIIASHLIEHTPDLIGFLNDCDSVLKDTGVLSLVIPDARYCFDHFRPLTGLSKIIDAHLNRQRIHTAGTVAEYFLNFVKRGGQLAWDAKTSGPFAFSHSPDQARGALEAFMQQHAYHDLHAWCFTPHSFRLILSDLFDLGLVPFRELAFFPTEGCEFFVTLGREGKGPAMDRQQMLERAHAERCCEAPEFGTQHSLRRSDLGLSPRLPLRYRLADRVVGTLKRGLGPLYAPLRSGLSRAGSIYQVFRRPGAIYTLIKTIKPIPILGPASGSAVRGLRRFRARCARIAILMVHLLRHPAAVTSLVIAYRYQGDRAFRDELVSQLPALRGLSAQEWFRRTRLTENQLARLRAQEWTSEAPRISIIMPVYNVRDFWLRQAISSVIAQTYPHWELICANDASPAAHVRPALDEMAARDSRVVVIHCAKNRGVSAATNIGLEAAKGDYVFFMDHDDLLEPHALQRCAEAILENRPDMIYSDQAFTAEDIDEIAFVSAVPAFSYDYYLSHPYFVHLIAAHRSGPTGRWTRRNNEHFAGCGL